MPRPKKQPAPTQTIHLPATVAMQGDSQLREWFAGKDPHSLYVWRDLYELLEGRAKTDNTQKAKNRDLALFLDYFRAKVGSDRVDDWTKPVTTGFLRWLEMTPVTRAGKESKRKAATVNRIFSTLRHFAGFVQVRRGFLAGSPTAGIKELVTDEPSWKGLADDEVMRLRSAAEQLLKLKTRGNQLPLRDKTVFLLLLHTGLRVSELVGLDRSQYRGKHLVDVKRKGKMRTTKIFLPKEAREALEEYLDKVRGGRAGALFCTRAGERMTRQDVDHLLRALTAQANAQTKAKRIAFSAHTLRHTFLRKVAQQHGVEFAMQMSGHASSKYIWRYVKPSDEQTEAALEDLF